MHDFDEVHEILRRAIACGRREICGRLISPRSIERVLRYRHEFYVREAQGRSVFSERVRNLPVRQHALIVAPPPRAQMHLVDRHRRIERIAAPALRHPGAVVPRIIERPGARRAGGRHFRVEGEWVCLVRNSSAQLEVTRYCSEAPRRTAATRPSQIPTRPSAVTARQRAAASAFQSPITETS